MMLGEYFLYFSSIVRKGLEELESWFLHSPKSSGTILAIV